MKVMLFFTNKIVPIESAQIPTRNFLNPCHRCRLAKLLDNQWIAGDKEAATVTRKCDFAQKVGVFCLKKQSKTGSSPDYSLFLGREKAPRSKIVGIPIKDRRQGDTVFHAMEQVIPPHGTKCSTPWNKQEGGTSLGGRYRFRGSNVPPSSCEGTGFVKRHAMKNGH